MIRIRIHLDPHCIGLDSWIRIRIRIEIKRWIRFRIETSADPQYCIVHSKLFGVFGYYFISIRRLQVVFKFCKPEIQQLRR